MSENYSLEIIEAIRTIFNNDNTDPDASNYKYCIHTFVGDRVLLENTPNNNVEYPQITISFDSGHGDGDLPVEHGRLAIKVWYKKTDVDCVFNTELCMSRISGLLNRKPSVINAIGRSVTVRLIDKTDEIDFNDPDVSDVYQGNVIFDVTYKRII